MDGEKTFYMGCYGIGVSRTVATIYEKNLLRDKNNLPEGICLPISVAPYVLQIIPKIGNTEKENQALEIYNILKENGINAILDDRQEGTIGSKIKDCKILGTPYVAILGDKTEEGKIEIESTKTGEKTIVDKNNIVQCIKKLN